MKRKEYDLYKKLLSSDIEELHDLCTGVTTDRVALKECLERLEEEIPEMIFLLNV